MELKKIKILAIDDIADNLISIKALLLEAFPDALVFTALGGLEGIALARMEIPDVVLLDIVMPGMDGFTVCQGFKGDPRLCDIPVVFVTALKGDKENRICALEAGAEGFLNKPIDESELAAMVRAMVKIRAAHVREQNEKERMERLVQERTLELERELDERRQTQAALLISEERYRRITEGITDYLYSVRIEKGNVVQTRHNTACEKVTGYTSEEFTADPYLWITMIPEDERDLMRARVGQIMAGEQTTPMEHRIRRKDGEVRWVSDTAIVQKDAQGAVVSYEGVIRDVTDIRVIESRLRQSEKMEAVGQLAGGIAHDFNNVLGGIIGYTDMSLELAEKGSAIERNLRKVMQAADRAKHLVKQILTFSRQGNTQTAVVAIRPIIKEVLELLKASIPSSVVITSELSRDTKPVLADSTKIHEMILNLATNAVYAMNRRGNLAVRMHPAVIDVGVYGRTGEIKPGEYVVIEISDTGCGMDAETIKKAFDPFFTTKPVGEGTGMGLSVVLGVVQSHGGDLQVESTMGKGTTFRIYLPVTELVANTVVNANKEIVAGTERVLFVDDESILVEMADLILTKLGYAVRGMTDSLEALKYIQENGANVDILVTDQTMPGLTGVELVKEALAIKTNLPVILCTGFSRDIDAAKAAQAGITRFMLKPYGSYEMVKAIRDVLDEEKIRTPRSG